MVLPDPDNFGLAADPSMFYGNSAYDMQASYYGDDQAAATGMRSSYGDSAYTAMRGAGAFGAGAYQGLGNMFSRIGSMVRPVTYTPPARVQTGYYGHYVQETGFLRGLTGMFGLNDVPRGTSAYEYNLRGAGDFGQRVASGVTAAGVMAGSIAAGYSLSGVGSAIGGTLGAAFGPVGAGVGASIGGLGASFVGAMGGDYLLNQVAARQNLGNYLEASSFRFVGAGSSMADPRFQAGMSRKARDEASSYIRGLDTKDPTMDTADLSTILQESTRLGLFTGTQDMDDFKKKFKDITENVKTVSKFLHTTLKEGLETIKQLKGIGIDVADSGTMAVQAAALGRVAGRTGSEMLGIGLQGAEMYRGTGVDMGIGAQASMMNLAQIRSARDAGLLSQQTIAQMGGEEAFALRKTASNLQFAQSSIGRGFNAAFFNPAMGNGGFDQQAFEKSIRDPNMSAEQQIIQSARNLGSPEAATTYMASQEKFVEGMQNAYGKQGGQLSRINAVSSLAKYYSKMMGGKVPVDVMYRAIGKQQFQLSDMEITEDLAVMKDSSGFFKKQNQAINAQEVMLTVEGAYINNPLYQLGGRIADATKEVADVALSPILRGMTATAEAFQSFAERRGLGLERSRAAELPDVSAILTKEIREGAAQGREKMSYDLTVGWNDQADRLAKLRRMGLVKYDVVAADLGTEGMAYLGGGQSITGKQLAANSAQLAKGFGASEKSLKDLIEEKKLTSPEISAVVANSFGPNPTLAQITQHVVGKSPDQITDIEEVAKVSLSVMNDPALKAVVDGAKGLARGTDFDSTMEVQEQQRINKGLEDYASEHGLGNLTPAQLVDLGKARKTKDPELLAKVLRQVRGEKKGFSTGINPAFTKNILDTDYLERRITATFTADLADADKLIGLAESQRLLQVDQGKRSLGGKEAPGLKDVASFLEEISKNKDLAKDAFSSDRLKGIPEASRRYSIQEAVAGRVNEATKIAADGFYESIAPADRASASAGAAMASDPGSGSKELADMSAERQMNAVIYENLLALANRLRL